MPIEGIDDKQLASHVDDSLSIYTMVRNRLPVLADDDINKLLVSQFILEVMHEINPCLMVDDSLIGIESNYTVIQQSIIADIVCAYILLSIFVQNMGGGAEDDVTGENSGGNTFLSKAKAGSVEVEFDKFSIKDSAILATTGPALLESFKRSAIKKAGNLGCIIDICDDCSISILSDQSILKPFIVKSNNCNC